MPRNDAIAFRRRCWFLAICSWTAVGLLLIILVAVAAFTHGMPKDWTGAMLYVIPTLFYGYALLALGLLFAQLARGAGFAASLATALRHSGAAIALGSVSSIGGILLVARMVTGKGSYLHFDVPGIVLACVGIGLVLLAQLFDRARELEAELNEMI